MRLRAGVELERDGVGQVHRQRHAGAVEALDRPQAPGQVLATLIGRLATHCERHAGCKVVVSRTPVSGSACSL